MLDEHFPMTDAASLTVGKSLHTFEAEEVVQAAEDGDWDIVRGAVFNAPHVTKEQVTFKLFKERTQGYLLHAIVTYRDVPPHIVKEVMDINKQAAATMDTKNQCLPIHVALHSYVPDEVLDVLVSGVPMDALKSQDNQGNTPLHLACFMSSPPICLKLMRRDPSVVAQGNEKKQLPLHMACSRSDASKAVVDGLLELHPNSAKAKNRQDQTPLHVACMWKTDVKIVEEFVRLFPQAVEEPDKSGRRPYELAKSSTLGGPTLNADPIIKILRANMTKGKKGLFGKKKEQAKFLKEDMRRGRGRRPSLH